MKDDNPNTNCQPGQYRDQELADIFAGDQTPDHQSDFWNEMKSNLETSDDMSDNREVTSQMTSLPAAPSIQTRAKPDQVASSNVGPTQAPLPEAEPTTVLTRNDTTKQATVIPLSKEAKARRTWPLLSAAAVTVALVGAGIWFGTNQSPNPQLVAADSASGGQATDALDQPTQYSDSGDPDEPDTNTPNPGDTQTSGSGTSDLGTSGSEPSDVDDTDLAKSTAVNYFSRAPQIVTIGTGSFVGFSPDNQHALVVDDLGNGETGCEGGLLLTLASQNLITGVRHSAIANEAVETGGLALKALGPIADTGHLKVAGTDFCDGFRSSTWTGTMEPDGRILDQQSVSADPNSPTDFIDDPFEGGVTAPLGARNDGESPDGRHQFEVEPRALVVTDDQGQRYELPMAEEAFPAAVWSQNGDVLAVSMGQFGRYETIIWDFRTGQTSASFSDRRTNDFGFDSSGSLLAISHLHEDGYPIVGIVNFGEERSFGAADSSPLTVDPSIPCSGAADPIGELNTEGVTPEVLETIVKIDTAAASCDWDLFGELVTAQFTASFGGGDGLEILTESESAWQQDNTSDPSNLQLLRQLLREPSYTSTVETDKGILGTTWPRVFVEGDCDNFTAEDYASMTRLGYGELDVNAGCQYVDGYAGTRTAIAEDGTWLFFVEGGD